MYVELFSTFYRVPVNSEENERQQCVQNGQNLRKRGFRGAQYIVLRVDNTVITPKTEVVMWIYLILGVPSFRRERPDTKLI